MLGWIDTLLQGVLLGGLYSLYATGLSVIFGIMRLVNLAHGDLIVLGAFLMLARDQPGRAACRRRRARRAADVRASATRCNRCCSTARSAATSCRRLLITFGLSIIVQNGLLETFSADTRRLDVGPLQSASLPLGGGIAIGVMPLICLAVGDRGHRGAQRRFYRTALGRAFRATSDDVEIAQLMGINNRSIYAMTMGIALAVCARRRRSSSARGPISIPASARRVSSTPSRRSSSAALAACGARSPAASSSASRRPSARTSIPNGRFFPAMSRF